MTLSARTSRFVCIAVILIVGVTGAMVLGQNPPATPELMKGLQSREFPADPTFNLVTEYSALPVKILKASVTVWKDKSKDQYYVPCPPMLNRKQLENTLDTIHEADPNIKHRVSCMVALTHEDIIKEVAERISEDTGKPVTVNNISARFPFRAVELRAWIGGREQIVYSDPDSRKLVAGQLPRVIVHPDSVSVTLTGTLSELKSFVEKPDLTLYGITNGGYRVKRSQVFVDLGNFAKMVATHELFGQATERNQFLFEQSMKGRSGGWNFIPFKSTKNGQHVKLSGSRDHERWVSRQQLANVVAQYSGSLNMTVWLEDAAMRSSDREKTRMDILNTLLEFVTAKSESAWFEFDQLHNDTRELKQVTAQEVRDATKKVGNLEEVTASPDMHIQSHDSVKYTELIEIEKDSTFTQKPEFYLKIDSGQWVPTHIKLYQVSDSGLQSLVRASFERLEATSHESLMKLKAVDGVVVVDEHVESESPLKVVSLESLNHRLTSLRELIATMRSTGVKVYRIGCNKGENPEGVTLGSFESGFACLEEFTNIDGQRDGAIVYVENGEWKLRVVGGDPLTTAWALFVEWPWELKSQKGNF